MVELTWKRIKENLGIEDLEFSKENNQTTSEMLEIPELRF